MIETAVADNLRRVTFDRPERRNALTPAALRSLNSTFEEATEPVVYLSGGENAFCAGADLDVVAGLDGANEKQERSEAERFGQLVSCRTDGDDGGNGK